MDYHALYAGIAAASGLTAIISLITKSIKEDVAQIKKDLHALMLTVKSEEELQRMISVQMNAHSEDCVAKVDRKIKAAITNHEKQCHE